MKLENFEEDILFLMKLENFGGQNTWLEVVLLIGGHLWAMKTPVKIFLKIFW